MKPGGQLRDLVESLSTADYPFVTSQVLDAEKKEPTWFLFSLLCYDIWKRQFFG
jgi:hypothetical protein